MPQFDQANAPLWDSSPEIPGGLKVTDGGPSISEGIPELGGPKVSTMLGAIGKGPSISESIPGLSDDGPSSGTLGGGASKNPAVLAGAGAALSGAMGGGTSPYSGMF